MNLEAIWHQPTTAVGVAALYDLLAATASRGILLLAVGGISALALRRRAAATKHLASTALMFGLVLLPALIAVLP